MRAKRNISRVKTKRLFATKRAVMHAPIVRKTQFRNAKFVVPHAPIVALSKKRKHRPHKPHRQYQREHARAILDRTPNWIELSDDDLVSLVEKELPGPGDKRKTILRAAGRLE
jgi:hypothetical protein